MGHESHQISEQPIAFFDPPPVKEVKNRGYLFNRTKYHQIKNRSVWHGRKCPNQECNFTGINETVCPDCGAETVSASAPLS